MKLLTLKNSKLIFVGGNLELKKQTFDNSESLSK